MRFLWFLLVVIPLIMCKHFFNEIGLTKGQFSLKQLHVIKNLQEYIRIDTSVVENYDLVVQFWKKMAKEIDLPIEIYWPAGLPVCVITWTGSHPNLPSIVLNTHSDVVKVYAYLWTHRPFAAEIDNNGVLYGRGAQDTKSLAIQHFEAIRELKQNNVILQRTVHMTIMPDEEIGGFRGIKAFVKTDHFKQMNVGFVLDEGLPSEDDTFIATYLDRRPWPSIARDCIVMETIVMEINMTLYGQGGHGSEMNEKGVMEKIQYILNSAIQFQHEQRKVMEMSDNYDMGRYTSVNVNIIKAGIATNIIPSSANLVIDIRLGTNANVSDIQNMVDTWQNATGPSTEVEYIRRDEVSTATPVDESNPYWVAMQDTAREMNITIKPVVCKATSDMLVLRQLGIPAIGFAPSINLTPRLHNNDEYMRLETLFNGIQIMKNIVRKLGNLSESE